MGWKSLYIGFAAWLICICAQPVFAFDEGAEVRFPRVPELEPNVRFWQKVYGVYSENEIAFHDPDDMRYIYKVIPVPPRTEPTKRHNTIKSMQDDIIAALKELADFEERHILPSRDESFEDFLGMLTPVARDVYLNTKDISGTNKYHGRKIRAQNGLRERFVEGYISSGAYAHRIRRILRGAGLPDAIIGLAFLESLMNIKATSYASAVGIWQFMSYTAGEYMTVSRVIDERRDPILATHAAAQYLVTARAEVGPWPLAITSYNFGRAGVRNMVKKAQTDDLAELVADYKDRRWGFAAQNYYVTFLAVVDIVQNPNIFFPEVQDRAPPWRFDVFRLPETMMTGEFLEQSGLSEGIVRELNPAITHHAFKENDWLPKGYAIRVPADSGERILKQLLTYLSSDTTSDRALARKPGKKYKVRRGDSLSRIAAKFKVSLKALMQRNRLRRSSLIRVGQKLVVPEESDADLSGDEEQPQIYTVVRGDSLSGIASAFQVPISALLEANDMSLRTILSVGQQLQIPRRTFGYSLIPTARNLDIVRVDDQEAVLSDYVARYVEEMQPQVDLGFRFDDAIRALDVDLDWVHKVNAE